MEVDLIFKLTGTEEDIEGNIKYEGTAPSYRRCTRSIRCRVYVTVGCPCIRLSVCLSVCSVDIIPAARARSQQQLCRSQSTGGKAGTRYRSTSADARAAVAGSVMLRAEVRGSTLTCSLLGPHRPKGIYAIYICHAYRPRRTRTRRIATDVAA